MTVTEQRSARAADGARAPAADSILYRRLSDPRAAAGAAGYALALQAAHPVVAAGTRDHSAFLADPWGRLFRTVDYVMLLGYGDGPVLEDLARRLRDAHRPIRGTDPQGRRYSALDPAAFAWVHATIADGVIRGHELLGTTLSPQECDEFWAQWLELGDVLGVRRALLPERWEGFDRYRSEMIQTTLEDNDIIQGLRGRSRYAVGGTPLRWVPSPVWGVVGIPAGRLLYFLGVGMLPAELRGRFGFRWTRANQVAFDTYCRASKASGAVLPRTLRRPGPALLRLRRRDTGPFGVVNAARRAG